MKRAPKTKPKPAPEKAAKGLKHPGLQQFEFLQVVGKGAFGRVFEVSCK